MTIKLYFYRWLNQINVLFMSLIGVLTLGFITNKHSTAISNLYWNEYSKVHSGDGINEIYCRE
jgi:hypothetical protein